MEIITIWVCIGFIWSIAGITYHAYRESNKHRRIFKATKQRLRHLDAQLVAEARKQVADYTREVRAWDDAVRRVRGVR